MNGPFITGLVKPDFYITSSGANIVDGDMKPILKRGVDRDVADALVKELQGQGYGTLKNRVADCVIAALEPMQNEYKRLITDKAYLQGVLDENAKTASYLANKTLRKVQKKVGFAARG